MTIALSLRLMLFCAIILAALPPPSAANDDPLSNQQSTGFVSVTRGIATLQKGIDPTRAFPNSTVGAQDGLCDFRGGKLVVGMPLSLAKHSKFLQFGQIQLASQALMVDYINQERCGIHLREGGNKALELRYFDDESSLEKSSEIAHVLVSNSSQIDFISAGYSSGLTRPLSKVTTAHDRLMIAAGSSDTNIYEESNTSFTILPPSLSYLTSAMEAVAALGAKTVGVVVYNRTHYSNTACGRMVENAPKFGMEVIGSSPYITPLDIPLESYEQVARNLSYEDPDVVFTCTYDCDLWVKAMRNVGWSPKAQVFTVCVGTPELSDSIGTDAEYLLGSSAWHPSSVGDRDALTGYSAEEFRRLFQMESSHQHITYHAAAFATAISILVQAIEETQSLEDKVLVDYIAKNAFNTTIGQMAFDKNGQSNKPMLVIQYQANSTIETVYPEEARSAQPVYPMPTWVQRDCIHQSICGGEGSSITGNGEQYCGRDGRCICNNPAQPVSVGQGETAACNPEENMNYFPEPLFVLGYLAFGMTLLGIILAAVWTYMNRFTWTVKAAQPELLAFILLGCFLSNLSIPFMGAETGYHEIVKSSEDVYPPEFSDNPDIDGVNASCMAVPWLYGIGFAVTFTALFVKIERVRLISKANKKEEADTNLGFRHVVHIMAVVLALELIVLICWQAISPFRWEREVLLTENGFPVESVGHCSSDYGNYFVLVMMILHMCLLLVALILSFQTRHIDEDFAESNSLAMIVAFMFQVMVLAVPIAILVNESHDIYYVVKVGVVALQNCTVLSLMFIPKIRKNAKAKDGARPKPNQKRKTIALASLTNNKWDEGVDLINELMRSPDLTEDQKTRLSGLMQLVLKGNSKKSKQEEKIAYLPTTLLLRSSTNKASRFVMEEYGGVDFSDDCSIATSLSAMSGHTRNSAIERVYETDSGLDAPSEFLSLVPKKQSRLRELLALTSLEQWGFDIFELAEITEGHPLLFMGWAILGSPQAQHVMARTCGERLATSPSQFQGYFFTNARKGFNIPMSTLCNYLRAIESDYNADNPYHNAIHAADVLQSLHSLLRMMDASCSSAGVRPNHSREHLFAVLLGAAVHDVKHPGRSNAFQVNAKTGYALTYNNESVLENMHVSHAFKRMLDIEEHMMEESSPVKVTEDSSLNIMAKMTQKQYDSVRPKIIEAILHTDMSKHFEGVANMKSLSLSNEDAAAVGDVAEQAPGPALFKKEENTWQLMMFLMHLADISGSAKPDPLFRKWSTRVLDEFFEQGDQEASLGLAISPLCDRNATKMADCQVGFVQYVIKPAYEVCGQLLPEVQKRILPIIDKNLGYWEEQKSKEEIDGEVVKEGNSSH